MTAHRAGPRHQTPQISPFLEVSCRVILFVTGVALVIAGSHSVFAEGTGNTVQGYKIAFDELDCGVCAIYAFLEGSYGALLTTVAGVSAIVAAGFSNFKMAYNLMIVSIGCFTIRSLISLYYGAYQCTIDRYPSIYGPQDDGGGDGSGQNTVGCSQMTSE